MLMVYEIRTIMVLHKVNGSIIERVPISDRDLE